MKPYDHIYINCYINNLLSLAVSANSSYRKLAWVNHHYYYICDSGQQKAQRLPPGFRFIMSEVRTEPFLTLYNRLFHTQIPDVPGMDFPTLGTETFSCPTVDSLLAETIERLNAGYVLFLGVDLFYYIRKSVFYGRRHRCHYSMVVSYDGLRFTVFDEGMYGYGAYTVEKETIREAVEHFGQTPNGLSYKPALLDDYTLDVAEIWNNAQRIRFNIARLEDLSTSLPSYIEANGYPEGANRCLNRQKANRCLFCELHRCGKLSSHDAAFLIDTAESLTKSWETFKGRAIRDTVTGNFPSNTELWKRIGKMLRQEKEMWRRLCAVL